MILYKVTCWFVWWPTLCFYVVCFMRAKKDHIFLVLIHSFFAHEVNKQTHFLIVLIVLTFNHFKGLSLASKVE